jgi:ABC-2 type transport system permease protein
MLAVLLVFGSLALCLSLLLPSRTLAASLTAGLMVASYLVTSLARINDLLESLNNLSPLKYYQGGRALAGLEWGSFTGLLAFALLFAVTAWLLFLRRDVRVSGEGSWRLPALRRK